MSLTDTRRLYDIATRVQVFTECVKLQQQQQLNSVLQKLSLRIVALLSAVNYATLDGLSKAELNKLLQNLNQIQYTVYSQYTKGLIDELKSFMAGSLQVNQQIYATSYKETDDSGDAILDQEQSRLLLLAAFKNSANDSNLTFGIANGTGKDMWPTISNSPLPANGLMIQPFVTGFAASAQASILNLVRKGYANKQSPQDIIAEIANVSKQGIGGQIQRIAAQGASVIATAMQHVAAMTSAAVSSILYAKYGWVSVMDSVTTEICQSRNGKIYKNGEGPLPPAHYRCRSHTVPIVGNSTSDLPDETFYEWAQAQPQVVQDDIGPNASKPTTPLSVADFVKKVPTILTR